MSRLLLLRADGDAQIGTGHVMRCLALAQAWQAQGGAAHFVCNSTLPAPLAERLRNEGATLTTLAAMPGSAADAAETVALATKMAVEWVVVDGYHFDAAYQQALKAAGLRLLFIDDHGHAAHYSADLVLNQNVYAQAQIYAQRDEHTQLLLGGKHALLRREFWPWRGRQRTSAAQVQRVLITLGGADAENVTLKALNAFAHIDRPDLELIVVVGASNPYKDSLAAAAAQLPQQVRLLQNVTDMPALMAEADLAITASGSTCWELLFMGLPAMLIEIAANQTPIAEHLEALDAAVRLGWHADLQPAHLAAAIQPLLVDPARRRALAAKGQELIDGYGSARVVQQLQGAPLRLSRSTERAMRRLWEWANEPTVRQASFRSEPIPWASHVDWFQTRLADPGFVQYIAWNADDVPVGQIRFDREGTTAIVGISIAADQRGNGYAPHLLRTGVAELARTTDVALVYAFIKVENAASLRSFIAAGFHIIGECEYHGHHAVELHWRRPPE